MKTKFPLEHVVKVLEKEVWIKCQSSITAMGIESLVNQYYPGYTGHIASENYFKTLKQKQQ
jgi:hypothetical protein